MNITQLILRYREIVLYGIIGSFCSGLDFVIYTLLIYLGVNLFVANTVGVVCGIATSFMLNRQFTFKVKDHTPRRFVIFFSVGLFGLALSSTLLYLLVDHYGVNKLYAKLMTIVVVALIQFLLNKFITFQKYGKSKDLHSDARL